MTMNELPSALTNLELIRLNAPVARKELDRRQRALDELAAKIVSTRRQLNGCVTTLAEDLGRQVFENGPIYGRALDDLADAERALNRLARLVSDVGGRA